MFCYAQIIHSASSALFTVSNIMAALAICAAPSNGRTGAAATKPSPARTHQRTRLARDTAIALVS